jgi:myo-inositol-1(or 4)-monophosphatase
VNILENNTLIKTALNAVLSSAKLAEAASGSLIVGHKGSLRDIVTQTDIDISDLLKMKLGTTNLPVISEEGHAPSLETVEVFWVVDPIDGTVNFSHGLAQYAISVGLVDHNEFKLGVVCAPALDELYFTLNSERALINGRPFTHTHSAKEDALVAASFSSHALPSHYALFQQVNDSTRGCLRTGSAALNICWAAVGKIQAAYGFQAKLWDVAGALAVARAAGCEIILRRKPDALTLDYCVGSRDAVQHVKNLAKSNKLWD